MKAKATTQPNKPARVSAFDSRRVLSYVVILAIAFIFAVQWGPGSKGCGSPMGKAAMSAAAVVNGKEIPLREFSQQYGTYLQYFRAQGGELPEALAKQMGLPSQVLERMIGQELLAQEAERRGVVASDEELRDAIVNNPTFQQDGHFDAARYHEVVANYIRKAVPEFEHSLRRDLGAQKLLEAVEQSALVSDDEARAKFAKEGNKANLAYVRFLPSMFASKVPAPKPAELTAYKKEHAKEIEDYYNSNAFLYQKGERVRARHILARADKNASPEQKAKAKEKIEGIEKELKAGKDFAALAKQHSEDPGTKDKGGDLGLNERSAWVPEFADAAFALKPGEVSKPVETPFGVHLIKVEEKMPAEKRALKDVEDEIARQLYSKGKAKEVARAEAHKALAALKSGKKLADLYPPNASEQSAATRFETETKPEMVQTGEFTSSGGSIPQLGVNPELTADVFAAQEPKPLDKVYAVGEGFAVAVVTDRKISSDAEFAASKAKLLEDARKAKQVELRDEFVKALRKSAKVETNAEALEQVGGG